MIYLLYIFRKLQIYYYFFKNMLFIFYIFYKLNFFSKIPPNRES